MVFGALFVARFGAVFVARFGAVFVAVFAAVFSPTTSAETGIFLGYLLRKYSLCSMEAYFV